MVYGTQIAIVSGANLNQLITGGPHIVVMGVSQKRWMVFFMENPIDING